MLTEAPIEAAETRGRELMAREPRAVAARFDPQAAWVEPTLANGCATPFPRTWWRISRARPTRISPVSK